MENILVCSIPSLARKVERSKYEHLGSWKAMEAWSLWWSSSKDKICVGSNHADLMRQEFEEIDREYHTPSSP